MMDCLIAGDSIAVGVGQVSPTCVTWARSGINSQTYVRDYGHRNFQADRLIISLGANDWRGIDTERHIRALRERARARVVYWILPNETLKPRQVEIIKRLALEWGDQVIDRPRTHMSADGVHPTYTGYRKLAEKIQ